MTGGRESWWNQTDPMLCQNCVNESIVGGPDVVNDTCFICFAGSMNVPR